MMYVYVYYNHKLYIYIHQYEIWPSRSKAKDTSIDQEENGEPLIDLRKIRIKKKSGKYISVYI